MIPKKAKITVIKIVTPWWLRWAERFISLKVEQHVLDGKGMRGYQYGVVIIDEVVR